LTALVYKQFLTYLCCNLGVKLYWLAGA